MKITIQVPKPCHESWEAMTADPGSKAGTSGRFCASCAHTVADRCDYTCTNQYVLDLLPGFNRLRVCCHLKLSHQGNLISSRMINVALPLADGHGMSAKELPKLDLREAECAAKQSDLRGIHLSQIVTQTLSVELVLEQGFESHAEPWPWDDLSCSQLNTVYSPTPISTPASAWVMPRSVRFRSRCLASVLRCSG